MTVRRRLSRILEARLDALLSRLEDPGEALELAYRTLLDERRAVWRAVDDVASTSQALEAAADRLGREAGALRTTAEEAMRRAREPLAGEALARAQVVEAGAGKLRGAATGLVREQRRFVEAARRLDDRSEALGGQREAMKVLHSRTGDRSRIDAALAELRAEAELAKQATRRAEAAVGERRAQVRRVDDLLASGALEDLDATPAALEAELREARASSELQQALAALRRAVSGAPRRQGR